MAAGEDRDKTPPVKMLGRWPRRTVLWPRVGSGLVSLRAHMSMYVSYERCVWEIGGCSTDWGAVGSTLCSALLME